MFIPFSVFDKTSFVLQFFVVYIVILGLALLGVWILNIALYVSVKRRPRLMETSRSHSIGTPTPPVDTLKLGRGRKSRTNWVSLTTLIRKQPSTASAVESYSSTTVQSEQSHQNFNRKHLELSLAKTVRYIVIAFTLALLPSIVTMVIGRLSTLEPSGSNFNPLAKAAWNGYSYLASRILFSNSFVNCVIYSYRSNNFRKTLKNLFYRFFKKG